MLTIYRPEAKLHQQTDESLLLSHPHNHLFKIIFILGLVIIILARFYL